MKIFYYFIALILLGFLFSCNNSIKSNITEKPTTVGLSVTYDESHTLRSIFKGDTDFSNIANNFTLTSNGTPVTVTADMISIDTSSIGEKIATITYNGASTNISVPICTPSSSFTVTSGSITRYLGPDSSVVIPRYINNTAITNIDSGAFQWMSTLTSIYALNIITIDPYAFYSCSNLSNIHLPNTTSIAGFAFTSCSSLKTIELPKIEFLGTAAFAECTSITSIKFGTTEPPTFSRGVFQGIEKMITTTWSIDVPFGSSSKYTTAFSGTENIFFNRLVPTINEY